MAKKINAPKARVLIGLAAIGAVVWGWQQEGSARTSHAKAGDAAAVTAPTAPALSAPSGQGR